MGDSNNILIGPCAISVDGTDVGFTKDGATVRFEREYVDVIADQAIGLVKKGRALEKMFVSTTLLEATLENLLITWDQPSSNLGGGTLSLGYNDACNLNEVVLDLTGVAPSCSVRTFKFYRAVAISEGEYPMKRDEESAIPVEFECLKRSSDLFFGYITE
jgi:hypothetical protein